MATVALLERALALLAAGDRGGELESLAAREIPAAMAERLPGRSAAGELAGGSVVIAITSEGMAPCRVIVTLGGGWARVRLDSAGVAVAPELERLVAELDYRAGELPSDHRWWSDVSGLLMLAELIAGT